MEIDPLIALLTTIPFLLTVFGLNVLVWQPTLALLAEREANIDGFMNEAERLQAEVATRTSELNAKLAEGRARATGERNRLRAASQVAEREIIDAARRTAEGQLAEARAVIEGERAVAQTEIQASVGALSLGIASAVLGRQVEAEA